MRSKQARTSFNNPGALSVLRMLGIFAVHPAPRVVSRRDFPRQKANSPESPRKVYENFFFRLYIFQRVRTLAGIADWNCLLRRHALSLQGTRPLLVRLRGRPDLEGHCAVLYQTHY